MLLIGLVLRAILERLFVCARTEASLLRSSAWSSPVYPNEASTPRLTVGARARLRWCAWPCAGRAHDSEPPHPQSPPRVDCGIARPAPRGQQCERRAPAGWPVRDRASSATTTNVHASQPVHAPALAPWYPIPLHVAQRTARECRSRSEFAPSVHAPGCPHFLPPRSRASAPAATCRQQAQQF